MDSPTFDSNLPFLNQFILELVDGYRAGDIRSWEALDGRVKAFFTPERMAQTEALVPGWEKMASYSEGITLTHIMCVFLGVFMLPEFQALPPEGQQLAKWIVLLHDVDKVHVRGKRDAMHAFRSGVVAAHTLPSFGFPVTDAYPEEIGPWSELTRQAFIEQDGGAQKPDNQKLPAILAGIDRLFGLDAPASLITKVVLLHISPSVDLEYPTPSPLTEAEIQRFITPSLFPLLRVMMLGDNEGWSLFEPETRARQRRDTLAAFQSFQRLIGQPL